MRDKLRRATEFVIESIVRLSGVLAIVFVVAIFGFLVREAAPMLRHVTLGEMLSGTRWLPTSTPPQFGMLPLILGSALVTVAAALIGVPLGVGCAIYVGELASPWLREVLKSTVEFLAAIPSVVLGLLGLLVLAPFLRELLDLPVGLTAGGIMAVVVALRRGLLAKTFKNLGAAIYLRSAGVAPMDMADAAEASGEVRLPYAIALGLGAIITLVVREVL